MLLRLLFKGLDVEDVIDAQGNVQPTETLAGTGLEIAPYVVGGTAIAEANYLQILLELLKAF